MARLDDPTYLHHLRRESARFRDVLAAIGPGIRVPTCPDWDTSDLLSHLARVQEFWTTIVRDRPAGPDPDAAEPARPASYEAMLARLDAATAALADELERADAADAAWTWSSEQTVGFTIRRQAHEALVHRLDAELAAGTVTPLDPALAADGVAEALDVMFGGAPSWGTFLPLPWHLRIDCTDTDDTTWVRLGTFAGIDPRTGGHVDEPGLRVVAVPPVSSRAEPDVLVAGPAGALDAWLWHRGDATAIRVSGDPDAAERLRRILDQPIE